MLHLPASSLPLTDTSLPLHQADTSPQTGHQASKPGLVSWQGELGAQAHRPAPRQLDGDVLVDDDLLLLRDGLQGCVSSRPNTAQLMKPSLHLVALGMARFVSL